MVKVEVEENPEKKLNFCLSNQNFGFLKVIQQSDIKPNEASFTHSDPIFKHFRRLASLASPLYSLRTGRQVCVVAKPRVTQKCEIYAQIHF